MSISVQGRARRVCGESRSGLSRAATTSPHFLTCHPVCPQPEALGNSEGAYRLFFPRTGTHGRRGRNDLESRWQGLEETGLGL